MEWGFVIPLILDTTSITANDSKPRLFRVFVEGFVIVVSILLAFAIDAWWEDRQEEELLEKHVGVLIAELSQTRSDIVYLQGRMEESLGATMQLLRWTSFEALMEEDLASFSDTYGKSMNVSAFLAEDVALTAMMTSGEVMKLSHPDILELLGQWQNQVEGLELDSSHLERNREETLLDRMIESNIDAIGFYQPFDEDYYEVARRDPAQERRFLEDQGIKTALAMRADRSARLLRD